MEEFSHTITSWPLLWHLSIRTSQLSRTAYTGTAIKIMIPVNIYYNRKSTQIIASYNRHLVSGMLLHSFTLAIVCVKLLILVMD